MRPRLLALLMLLPGALCAETYSLRDEGDFAPAGYRVEFADRYGWRRYRVDFNFGLEEGGRALTPSSTLRIKIDKRDGSSWKYSCKARKDDLGANINFLQGKGISVVADCRIARKAFAKAVGLHKEDVGLPTLVFQAMIREGRASPGAQRGLSFLPAGRIESSELSFYASLNEDPTNLAVVFRSN